MLIMQKGDILHCNSCGAECFEATREIMHHSIVRHTDFKAINGSKKPELFQPINCYNCGTNLKPSIYSMKKGGGVSC